MEKSILVYPIPLSDNFENWMGQLIPKDAITAYKDAKKKLRESIDRFYESKKMGQVELHASICNWAKNFLDVFNSFYIYFYGVRNSICTKRLFKSKWRFYNNKKYNPVVWNSWKDYSFTAFLTEGIMAVCCLCFSRYNISLFAKSDKFTLSEKKDFLIRSIKDTRYVWSNYVLEFKTKDELLVPFEMTSTGTLFYRKLFEASLLRMYTEEWTQDYTELNTESLDKMTPIYAKLFTSTSDVHNYISARANDSTFSNLFVDPIATEEIWNSRRKEAQVGFMFLIAIGISLSNHLLCLKICNLLVLMLDDGYPAPKIDAAIRRFQERKSSIYHMSSQPIKNVNIDEYIDGKLASLTVNYDTMEKKYFPILPLVSCDENLSNMLLSYDLYKKK